MPNEIGSDPVGLWLWAQLCDSDNRGNVGCDEGVVDRRGVRRGAEVSSAASLVALAGTLTTTAPLEVMPNTVTL